MVKLKKRKASRGPEGLVGEKCDDAVYVSADATQAADRAPKSKKAKRKISFAVELEQAENGEDMASTPQMQPKPKKIGKRARAEQPVAEVARHDPATSSGGKKPKASEEMFVKDTTFLKLGLSRALSSTCEKLGMLHPTDVQAMCLPPVLRGKNVAGNAKTGSGKTACYCLPILHQLAQDPYGIFALVLTPVRELAYQVADNFRALGNSVGVSVTEVTGGGCMMTQSRKITERTHIIVATPGRLADLLRGDDMLTKSFRGLRTFVLDEADELLTKTFEDPLAQIISVLPKERQTLLFSATLTKSIERLASRISNLQVVNANPKDETLENLTQEYVFVPSTVHICYLHYLLSSHFQDQSCIVFAPTIEMCQLLTTMFNFLGFKCTGLHSLQTQRERQAGLGKFRAGQCSILFATDIASRGLDIPKVAVVINLGLPPKVENYVHRSGRTARAGRPGTVVSIVTERDVPRVGPIETSIGKKLELRETNEDEALKFLAKTTKARQEADLLLSEVGFEEKVQAHKEGKKIWR